MLMPYNGGGMRSAGNKSTKLSGYKRFIKQQKDPGTKMQALRMTAGCTAFYFLSF
jgi:hypothetical protein